MDWNVIKNKMEKPKEETKSMELVTGEETTDATSSDMEVRDERELKEFNIETLSQMAKRRGMRILVIGKPKVGKTRFGSETSKVESDKKVLYIDTEDALSVFEGADFLDPTKIDVVNLYDSRLNEMDSIKMISKLQGVLEKLTHDINFSNQYHTVVLDSESSIWEYLQDYMKYEITRIGLKLNIKGVPSDRRDWRIANSKHWGIMQTLTSGNRNVIITVQAQPEYDQQGNMRGYKPSMQKKTEFFADITIVLDKRTDAMGNNIYFGKVTNCRYPLPGIEGKIIENPSFQKIKELVFGNKK